MSCSVKWTISRGSVGVTGSWSDGSVVCEAHRGLTTVTRTAKFELILRSDEEKRSLVPSGHGTSTWQMMRNGLFMEH